MATAGTSCTVTTTTWAWAWACCSSPSTRRRRILLLLPPLPSSSRLRLSCCSLDRDPIPIPIRIPMAAKAKAIRVHELGGPEVMRWEEVEVGDPKEGEIRIRTTAIGVNFIDVYFRKGVYAAPAMPFTPGTLLFLPFLLQPHHPLLAALNSSRKPTNVHT